MDEPPSVSPLDAPSEEAPGPGLRSRRASWARLLLTLLVILGPLGYLIGQQSPDLLPRAVAALTPPTATHNSTATPVPLMTILRARPLRLPTLPSGSACPVTPARTVNPGIAEVAGDGPVYFVDPYETIFVPFAQVSDAQKWATQDRAWFLIRPGVEGDVLVRGHQVDGPNEVRFGNGDTPDAELVFKAPAQARLSTDNDLSVSFNTMRLRTPGCYAVQVDTETASSVIVFRAATELTIYRRAMLSTRGAR